MTKPEEKKLEELKNILTEMKSVLIAFSGGVDSSFLLKVAYDVLKEKVLAVTASSPIQPAFEQEEAKHFALSIGANHLIIPTHEMSDEEFTANPPNRCYHCKKSIFSELKQIAIEKGIPFVADGSNIDDMKDYRPGMRALRELNIRSPLKEANLTKAEIRSMSKQMGLPTWNTPPLACLASRIPYDSKITLEKLRRIDIAESFLRDIGIKQVRVRDHDNIARIEVLPVDKTPFFDDELSSKIVLRLKKLGFTYVTLDLQGYRTGSLNEKNPKNG
ncbi:ATP-dependent sacrificial sulfur transferase LarE [bacterium]